MAREVLELLPVHEAVAVEVAGRVPLEELPRRAVHAREVECLVQLPLRQRARQVDVHRIKRLLQPLLELALPLAPLLVGELGGGEVRCWPLLCRHRADRARDRIAHGRARLQLHVTLALPRRLPLPRLCGGDRVVHGVVGLLVERSVRQRQRWRRRVPRGRRRLAGKTLPRRRHRRHRCGVREPSVAELTRAQQHVEQPQVHPAPRSSRRALRK
mmetsp:Transcript_64287/g.191994  ORF Transcript_64287/g.191994 Transcript_64287/m.191994 type:complete len:214 (+) Transcript_64287:902-1543(+)